MAVSVNRTTRRSADDRSRPIRPLRISRSHIRVPVDGATPSSTAMSATFCGPREASTTSARYWGSVTSESMSASDRAAMPTSARLADSNASTASDGASPPGLITPAVSHRGSVRLCSTDSSTDISSEGRQQR